MKGGIPTTVPIEEDRDGEEAVIAWANHMNMKPRVKVIVTLFNTREVLLAEGIDPQTREPFYVPIGGGLEFGETLLDCARREVLEETGCLLNKIDFLAHIENQFTYGGAPGHEIVFLFAAGISSAERAEIPQICKESSGESFRVRWYSKADFRGIVTRVVPPEIVEHVTSRL